MLHGEFGNRIYTGTKVRQRYIKSSFSACPRLKGSVMLFQCRLNLLQGVTVASNGPKRTPFKPYLTISKFI